ncbi:hypothetical protein GCM10027169_09230 [Gordonia jinhuaensis]|uniref:Cholesterol esterase n=1 Tax=Gordonia jinhuaensis TaxID=1517702 RepID=A0A916TH57_9ACTN|nr:DUF6230 family protein [Gordonia jinhuaensis]GGB42896.1 hypothetical protein GCM10011489_32990 [Gordonia jinhuaensis]
MGAVRKRWFVVIAAIGFAAASILGVGIARGDLPVNISVSGQSFNATMGRLDGDSVTVYPHGLSTPQGASPGIAVKLAHATITDLCLSMVAHDVPVIGDVTMFVRAPGRSTTADDLVIDATQINGSLNVNGLFLGIQASAIDPEANSATAGIAAKGSTLTDADITTRSLRASSLRFTKFTVSITRGDKRC